MGDTTKDRTAAGRCIPLIRPHRWTRWRLTERKLFGGGALSVQARECLRCGRTEMSSPSPVTS